MWETSNPALTNDKFHEIFGERFGLERANVTTLAGVVNKTAVLVSVAVLFGALGYWLFGSSTSVLLISGVAALLIGVGLGFVLAGKPSLAPMLAPIYAAVEGVFLGALTGMADMILADRGLAVALGGVGVQAFIITAATIISMLGLYKAGIVRPSQTLKAVLCTATGAIMLAYLVSFVLSFFWQPLPLISFYAATTETGWMGLLGLGINVFILGIAAFWLVIDFGMVEQQVRAGAPRYMEWYCGFALLVTIAWIYYEAVKLVLRLALLFGRRD